MIIKDLTSKQTELFPGTGLHLSLGSLSTPVSRKAKLQDAGSLLILSEPTPFFVIHIRSLHSKSTACLLEDLAFNRIFQTVF